MRVLLAVLFLLIAHEGTYAKPKPKPKPKAHSPFGNVFSPISPQANPNVVPLNGQVRKLYIKT